MSTRITGTEDVLSILQSQSAATARIAVLSGLKPASVRRSIQELRTQGHNIVYVNGLATLQADTATQQTPATV